MSALFRESTQAIVDAISAKCEGAHYAGNQIRARCPLHQGESDTSLVVTSAGDKVLIMCHAGCDTKEILDAMNLTFEDLYVQTLTNYPPNKRIAKIYDYYDETGTLKFQTLRYEPKAFKQRRPDGQGEWTSGNHFPDGLGKVASRV